MKGQVVTPMRTYGLRFDVNCSILFTELPLARRVIGLAINQSLVYLERRFSTWRTS